jgi:hypothetical protein
LRADQNSTVAKAKVVGRSDDEDIRRLNQAVFGVLGLAVSPRTRREA